MSVLSISLPDGSARELPAGSTVADLAASIGSRLAKAALTGVVNGAEVDLNVALADGDVVSIVTADSDAGRQLKTVSITTSTFPKVVPSAKQISLLLPRG